KCLLSERFTHREIADHDGTFAARATDLEWSGRSLTGIQCECFDWRDTGARSSCVSALARSRLWCRRLRHDSCRCEREKQCGGQNSQTLHDWSYSFSLKSPAL